ncbi:MAG: hypothetical protein ACK55X_12465 [Synechococcaceae cyanobacterium]|jgi:hypothetical protein
MVRLALLIAVGFWCAPFCGPAAAVSGSPPPLRQPVAPSPGLEPAAAPPLLARERSHRGSGGRHGGGGHARRDRSGFSGRHASLDRGNRRPDGGWSRRIGEGDRARRQFDRARRDLDRRDLERHGRRWLDDGVDGIDRDRVKRSFERVDHLGERARREVRDLDLDRRVDRAIDRGWDRADRAIDRADRVVDQARAWDEHWPGWVRPGWALARPWHAGWYGTWNSPPWGWWGGRSLAWGIGGLASAAAINAAVDSAIAASRPTIAVADSGYSLAINSIEPSGEGKVRFIAATGETRFEASADCRAGELNGREPASSAQAELLNAACQVAFGR